MAYRSILAATLAATLSLTACVSPYEEAIKTDLVACHAGDEPANHSACDEAWKLQTQDRIWHEQKNQEVGNAILGILAVGVAAAGVAAASRPPPPVFVPPPPVIFVPRW